MSTLHEEFVSITGASLDDALTWLEIGQYDLQNAIDLFLSSNQHQQTHKNYQNHKDNPSLNDYVDADAVRMPDSVKRGRLMDESFMTSSESSSYIDLFLLKNTFKCLDKTARPVIKSAFTSGSGFLPKNDKEKTLADIYKPPVDLMVLDTFDGVLFVCLGMCQF